MRIGITGARGVLGSRIAAALVAHGHHVDAFVGDVRDADGIATWVAGIDTVVHCAAIVPVQQVAEHAGAAIAINVGGTANIAAAVARSRCRLVYISTSHVYHPSATPLLEIDAIAPVSLYGLTKWQGEEWVRRLTDDALVLRLFSYFDERQAASFLVPGLLARIGVAESGATIDLLGGHNRRDMASAAWLADACVALLEAGATGIVNCATGRGLTVLAIAQAVGRATGRDDIQWNVVQDRPVDALVSDDRRLRSLAPALDDFDLDAALTTYVHCAAPMELGGKEGRLREYGRG